MVKEKDGLIEKGIIGYRHQQDPGQITEADTGMFMDLVVIIM